MSKRRNRLLQKRFFVFLLFYASFWAAIAESALLPAVKALAEKAFAQKNTAAVSAVFQKGIDSCAYGLTMKPMRALTVKQPHTTGRRQNCVPIMSYCSMQ